RELLSVIGLEGDADTPVNQGAPILGAGGITMTHAKCPAGTGPSLHTHQQTFETFTVLRGRFEVTWNDDGAQRIELEEFDTISVPPGVCRAFRNIGDEEGLMQVVISGGVHDMKDIDFTKEIADQLASYGDDVVAQFEARGMTFTAGKDAV
ncbi:MAG: cupin domain-containing protein, partial [Alphaproteobacteria bacterium]